MKTTKKTLASKIVSITLAILMTVGILPTAVFADTAEYVYISVSYDDKFINDKNGTPIAYIPVSFDTLAGIDLAEYSLENMLYDEDGDGTYETTALQLIIYAHEELYGGSWSDVTFEAIPGSSYFAGGLFGQDENLNYYLNGQYPLAGSGWGATSDRIVLEAGDVISLAGVLFKKGWLRRTRASLAVVGAFTAVIIYGGIMNPAAEPMLEKMNRIKVKYGLAELYKLSHSQYLHRC